MPKAAPQSEQDGEPAFEDALRQLESIVEAMESDDLPLDQLLERFEEGTRLAQLCQNRLSTAEIRIRKLEETLGGTLVAKPTALDSGDAA